MRFSSNSAYQNIINLRLQPIIVSDFIGDVKVIGVDGVFVTVVE